LQRPLNRPFSLLRYFYYR